MENDPGEEAEMSGNRWIRTSHRWLSLAFTMTVIANFVFMAIGHGQPPPAWVTYSPLLPLAFLWLSGVYLFVLRLTRRAGLDPP
jgi:hypothetical protein